MSSSFLSEPLCLTFRGLLRPGSCSSPRPRPPPSRYQRRTRPPTEQDLLRPGATQSPAADKRVVMASVPGDCVRRLKRWGSCCLPDTSGRLQANKPQLFKRKRLQPRSRDRHSCAVLQQLPQTSAIAKKPRKNKVLLTGGKHQPVKLCSTS